MRRLCAFSVAFVEFKDQALVTSLLKEKQEVKMGDRILVVDSAGQSKKKQKKTPKVNNENKKAKEKPPGTWNATSKAIIIFRFIAMLLYRPISLMWSPLLCAAVANPNNMLYLNNLSSETSGKSLKKLFPAAVNITLPQVKGKSKG